PVCLAVVPFAIGYEQAGIPREHWHSGETFALERNPALVRFLRALIRSGRLAVALYGYPHQAFAGDCVVQAAPHLPARASGGTADMPRSGVTAAVPAPPSKRGGPGLKRRGADAATSASRRTTGR